MQCLNFVNSSVIRKRHPTEEFQGSYHIQSPMTVCDILLLANSLVDGILKMLKKIKPAFLESPPRIPHHRQYSIKRRWRAFLSPRSLAAISVLRGGQYPKQLPTFKDHKSIPSPASNRENAALALCFGRCSTLNKKDEILEICLLYTWNTSYSICYFNSVILRSCRTDTRSTSSL